MSTLPEPAADETPRPRTRTRGRWKRWALIDLVVASVTTYVSIAFLGMLESIMNMMVGSNTGDRPFITILAGVLVFLVNLFIVSMATIVIIAFVSFIANNKKAGRRTRRITKKRQRPEL